MKKPATKTAIEALGEALKNTGLTSFADIIPPELQKEIDRSNERRKELSDFINTELEANAHHEKAIGILKKAIQSATDDPVMTPEIRKVAEMFILLIEDRHFCSYDCEDFLYPAIDIGKKEGRTETSRNGGRARAKNDPRTAILEEIKNEAIEKAREFRRYGYQAKFVRDMLAKYPDGLKDSKAILKLLVKLKKDGSIHSLNKDKQ